MVEHPGQAASICIAQHHRSIKVGGGEEEDRKQLGADNSNRWTGISGSDVMLSLDFIIPLKHLPLRAFPPPSRSVPSANKVKEGSPW